jgi:hypothetical protein
VSYSAEYFTLLPVICYCHVDRDFSSGDRVNTPTMFANRKESVEGPYWINSWKEAKFNKHKMSATNPSSIHIQIQNHHPSDQQKLQHQYYIHDRALYQ